MTTARIKINIGNITVEIEAPIDKIEEAVKNTINAIKVAEPTASQTPSKPSRKPITCKSAVSELIETGWMDEGRSLAEVVAELGRRGFFYDATAVAHVLLDLVREGVLERMGEPRRYLYVVREQAKKSVQMSEEDSTK